MRLNEGPTPALKELQMSFFFFFFFFFLFVQIVGGIVMLSQLPNDSVWFYLAWESSWSDELNVILLESHKRHKGFMLCASGQASDFAADREVAGLHPPML